MCIHDRTSPDFDLSPPTIDNRKADEGSSLADTGCPTINTPTGVTASRLASQTRANPARNFAQHRSKKPRVPRIRLLLQQNFPPPFVYTDTILFIIDKPVYIPPSLDYLGFIHHRTRESIYIYVCLIGEIDSNLVDVFAERPVCCRPSLEQRLALKLD